MDAPEITRSHLSLCTSGSQYVLLEEYKDHWDNAKQNGN